MPAKLTPTLGLAYGWNLGEGNWNTGADNNQSILDAVIQLNVKTATLSAPPASPAEGDKYIIGPNPTGIWQSNANKIAMWINGSWIIVTPRIGWSCWIVDVGARYTFKTAGWTQDTIPNTATTGANSFSGDQNLNGHKLINAVLLHASESFQALGTIAAAGTATVDLANGNNASFTVAGAWTLAFANVPPSGNMSTVRLWITNGGLGTPTFPSGIKWPGKIPPNFQSNGTDFIELMTTDGGTTWYSKQAIGY